MRPVRVRPALSYKRVPDSFSDELPGDEGGGEGATVLLVLGRGDCPLDRLLILSLLIF